MRISKQTILLLIIYLAFISLGLPDGMLGIAWPSIRTEYALPLASLSVMTTLLLCMSVLASLFSRRVLTLFGTGWVTCISCVMTGVTLMGFLYVPHYLWLLLAAIPLGLGQGSVDCGLNLYVATYFSARHMNWLHCFWGIGASLGPLIMGSALQFSGWRMGFGHIGCIQLVLGGILLVSVLFKCWPKEEKMQTAVQEEKLHTVGLFARRYQICAVLLFFLYSGIEFSIGTWLYTYITSTWTIPVATATFAVTAFYGCIMTGRFLSGLLVERIGNEAMIRHGFLLAMFGCCFLLIDGGLVTLFIAACALGLGFAPIYPCLMHATPYRFSNESAKSLIGYQVGAATLGAMLISASVGGILSQVAMQMYAPALLVLIVSAAAINRYLQVSRAALVK